MASAHANIGKKALLDWIHGQFGLNYQKIEGMLTKPIDSEICGERVWQAISLTRLRASMLHL